MLTYSGYCKRCGKSHSIDQGDSIRYGLDLLGKLEKFGNLEFNGARGEFSTDYLYGHARGQMFGVMVCRDESGREVVLKAFSGQYNGHWIINGWVPPVLNWESFVEITPPVDKKIKELSFLIDAEKDLIVKRDMELERKRLSQNLMKETHALYSLRNFRGEENPLVEVFKKGRGIPTGTADCCAPKLVNHAVRNRLKPTGMCEFFFGKANLSGTRKHGEFYSSCEDKCEPILGFMLCGLDEL